MQGAGCGFMMGGNDCTPLVHSATKSLTQMRSGISRAVGFEVWLERKGIKEDDPYSSQELLFGFGQCIV
jgi:hypothetical protein